jgi:spore coat polysaccharide biosynthesis predicted glycosyltransferase SpsG
MHRSISLIFTLILVFLYLFFENDSTIFENSNNIKKNEKYYQSKMCQELGGRMEYVLYDKSRVDCLTDEYAIEVDFAKKWAESIGQALYYADVTGKKAAIGLIVGSGDEKYLNRIKRVADKFDIKIIILNREM